MLMNWKAPNGAKKILKLEPFLGVLQKITIYSMSLFFLMIIEYVRLNVPNNVHELNVNSRLKIMNGELLDYS